MPDDRYIIAYPLENPAAEPISFDKKSCRLWNGKVGYGKNYDLFDGIPLTLVQEDLCRAPAGEWYLLTEETVNHEVGTFGSEIGLQLYEKIPVPRAAEWLLRNGHEIPDELLPYTAHRIIGRCGENAEPIRQDHPVDVDACEETKLPDSRMDTTTPAGNGTPTEQGTAKYPTPENLARDKWIYEQRAAKKLIPDIIRELENNKNGWGPLYSDNGIRDAEKRYAKHMKSDRFKGKPGKPRRR